MTIQVYSKYHICKWCDKEFMTKYRLNSSYCSSHCKYMANWKKLNEKRINFRKKNPLPTFDKECLECHSKFVTTHKDKIYCSINCRKTYYKNNGLKSYSIELMKNKLYRLRFEILKRDNFRCQYCGRNPKQDGCKLHIDHIIPVNLGGNTIPENLVTSCEACNLGKSDNLLEIHYIKKLEVKKNA